MSDNVKINGKTPELRVKLLMIGDSGVGKSSLLMQYTEKVFNNHFISTIGVDFKIKNVEIDGKSVKMQIWDTAGQERFKTITSSYYRGAQGIIVVFDLANRESFENVKNWLGEIKKHSAIEPIKDLVGNKSDEVKKRCVTFEEAKTFANKNGMEYIESSAMEDKNVSEMFIKIAQKVCKNGILNESDSLSRKVTTGLSFEKDTATSSSSCCG